MPTHTAMKQILDFGFLRGGQGERVAEVVFDFWPLALLWLCPCVCVWLCCWMEVSVVGGGGACESRVARVLVQDYEDDK